MRKPLVKRSFRQLRRRWWNRVKRAQGDGMEPFLGHGNWRVERRIMLH